jgi:membrane-bound lytic murein transglycosylase A
LAVPIRMGNVLFTGYYSPVLEVRHRPDAQYKYPIYAMPNCGGRCPSRAEIHRGAGQPGLELGYSKSLIDNFLMDVQGSGFVHYGDDDRLQYLATAARTATAMSALAGCSSTVAKCPRSRCP